MLLLLKDWAVAVRSSGIAEDGEESSFAGICVFVHLYISIFLYLYISISVIKYVQKKEGGLLNPSSYELLRMSVVVQKQINSKCAGYTIIIIVTFFLFFFCIFFYFLLLLQVLLSVLIRPVVMLQRL